ncbi:sulfotransferase [Mesorhizobium sp. WSM3876]|uniref:sulfotransferase family protein n=1 Tax=Mesorhizobium sp. WSM3876 TaxID=422277 RepID=UPI001596FDF2|nr:sulfotransferase [Mesorhizobium sp. WSM3876]
MKLQTIDNAGPLGTTQASALPPPIVVINTAHSGSRLLARVLMDAGVYMGTNLNESLDCLEIQPLVEHAVLASRNGVPAGRELDDPQSRRLAERHFGNHLRDLGAAARWGWKLCETLLIVPLIRRYFPKAIFIHLVRDGRDVALSPFVAPKAAFWRKVYFGSSDLDSWHGYPMTQRAYRARGMLFNAHRWQYHVDLAREFSQTLGERYIEVKYEDLVLDYEATVSRLFGRLSLSMAQTGKKPRLPTSSIGKWRQLPQRDLDALCAIMEPTLSEVGYTQVGDIPPARRATLLEKLAYRRYF